MKRIFKCKNPKCAECFYTAIGYFDHLKVCVHNLPEAGKDSPLNRKVVTDEETKPLVPCTCYNGGLCDQHEGNAW